MSEPKETGAVLELGQAATRISAALAAHADAPTDATMEAVQAAFSAYVTALGSNTTAMTAGGLGLVYKKLDKLTITVSDHTELVDHRFQAYNAELNEYRRQNNDLLALVEERLLGPFGQVVQRVGDLEYGYTDLAERLDAALDPNTPGATVAMVAVQARIDTLERLVRILLIAIAVLAVLSIAQAAGLLGHHYYIWERLR